MLGNIGSSEIVVLAIIGVLALIFGKDKMKDMARGLGESTKELKRAKEEYEKAITLKPIKQETEDVESKET